MDFLRRFLAARRRSRLEITDELWAAALEQHPICRRLPESRQDELRTRTAEVLARISLDTARGVPRDAGLLLSVALQAALPVLELGVNWYRAVRTVLLVPGEYETELTTVDEAGVVHEGIDTISGEVGHQRPVVLSVADVEASGWGEGYNVVIHEMAHVIDGTSGELDGVPALPPGIGHDRWGEILAGARSDHERRVRRTGTRTVSAGVRTGRPSARGPVIDPYGAEGPEEFFACACELFFERPARLRRAYPELYGLFTEFFGFDPAGSALE
jgi:Mlc titration factor MtfA (ptsG expression regulator)